MKTLYTKIINNGIDQRVPISEYKKIRLLNAICSILFIPSSLIIITRIFEPDKLPSNTLIIDLVQFLTPLIVLILQRQQFFTLARILLIYLSVTTFFILSLFAGKPPHLEYFNLIFTGLAIFLFDNKRQIILTIILLFMVHIIMIALYDLIEPINPVIPDKKLLLMVPISMFIITAAMFGLFRFENDRYQKIVELQKQELSKLNDTKSKFIKIISHDLKSPFSGIIGLSELAIEGHENITKQELLDFMESIHKTMTSTFILLQNLLDWSRSQTNDIQFHPEIIDINEIIESNLELFSETARLKKIDLTSELPDESNAYGDYNMINTVCRNLISNALKYTHMNGKIAVKVSSNQKNIHVSIEDNGTGIAPHIRENIFQVSEHISEEGTYGETGTGLGLILSKEFMDRNGGEIWVQSEPGKGSKFTFSLKKQANT